MKEARDTPELRQTLERACAERGLSLAGARLIHRYSNAVYLLPAEQAVARITNGSGRQTERSHQVTGWLVEHRDVAATGPLISAPPIVISPSEVVSFWTYYPQPDEKAEPTSMYLAQVLRGLHAVDELPFELETWQPLASLSTALRDPGAARNIADTDRAWLFDHVEEVRAQVLALDSPLGYGVIHGDAWAGNLLWNIAAGPDAVVIGDWDWVSYGPREVDLIPTWHAAIRYGRGQQWAKDFADVYGYDLASWGGFSTLLAMRDLVQLTGPLRRAGDRPEFAAALRERLNGIRAGGTTSFWRAL